MRELCDECQSELGICFARVEQGSINQLALSFETDGGDHFSASRARAIASGRKNGGAPSFDFGDPSLELDSPCLFDLRIFGEASDQAIGEVRSPLHGEFHCFCFQDFNWG